MRDGFTLLLRGWLVFRKNRVYKDTIMMTVVKFARKMSEQDVYELLGPVAILFVALIVAAGFAYG
jgi:hypothetical protein